MSTTCVSGWVVRYVSTTCVSGWVVRYVSTTCVSGWVVRYVQRLILTADVETHPLIAMQKSW